MSKKSRPRRKLQSAKRKTRYLPKEKPPKLPNTPKEMQPKKRRIGPNR